MRHFALKLLTFFAIALVITVIINLAAFNFYAPKDIDACYLWGDSQIYQGIDISYLNAYGSRKYYSSAQHGAGVYDFLVFTETVPKKSRVIISISHPALIRKKIMIKMMHQLI